jgi:hypothetical protein
MRRALLNFQLLVSWFVTPPPMYVLAEQRSTMADHAITMITAAMAQFAI